MPNSHPDLDNTFGALADPTRRLVLERLSRGPASVSELAKPFEMALPSFMQHLRVLERSRLVHSKKIGRIRTFYLVPQNLEGAGSWLGAQLEVWKQRLDQFDTYVTELEKEQNHE